MLKVHKCIVYSDEYFYSGLLADTISNLQSSNTKNCILAVKLCLFLSNKHSCFSVFKIVIIHVHIFSFLIFLVTIDNYVFWIYVNAVINPTDNTGMLLATNLHNLMTSKLHTLLAKKLHTLLARKLNALLARKLHTLLARSYTDNKGTLLATKLHILLTTVTYLTDSTGASGGADVWTVSCLDLSMIWPSSLKATRRTKWVVPGRHLLITQLMSFCDSLTSRCWKEKKRLVTMIF